MALVKKSNLEKISDKELENYINENSRFVSLAIAYAFEILKERGKVFSDIETRRIEQLILKKNETEKKELLNSKQQDNWEKNVVDDKSFPKLYSRRSIYLFSIFFGIIVGSILQAINCKIIGKAKASVLTIVFGIVFTILQIILTQYINEIFIFKKLTFVFSAFGALILDFYFWNQYLGKDFKYKKKEIWIPLGIALIVYVPILFMSYKR